MSPLERALVGAVPYAAALVAAFSAGLLTGPPTPAAVQLAVFLLPAAAYGFLVESWWALLLPAAAALGALVAYGDEPTFIENSDGSLGQTLAAFDAIAGTAIATGVAARKLVGRFAGSS